VVVAEVVAAEGAAAASETELQQDGLRQVLRVLADVGAHQRSAWWEATVVLKTIWWEEELF
jgi:hypothetical protein